MKSKIVLNSLKNHNFSSKEISYIWECCIWLINKYFKFKLQTKKYDYDVFALQCLKYHFVKSHKRLALCHDLMSLWHYDIMMAYLT